MTTYRTNPQLQASVTQAFKKPFHVRCFGTPLETVQPISHEVMHETL